jgi:hypothetical protein
MVVTVEVVMVVVVVLVDVTVVGHVSQSTGHVSATLNKLNERTPHKSLSSGKQTAGSPFPSHVSVVVVVVPVVVVLVAVVVVVTEVTVVDVADVVVPVVVVCVVVDVPVVVVKVVVVVIVAVVVVVDDVVAVVVVVDELVTVVEDAVELIPHVPHLIGHKKAIRANWQNAASVTSVSHSSGSGLPSHTGVVVVELTVVVDEHEPHMFGQSSFSVGPTNSFVQRYDGVSAHVGRSSLP